MGTPPSTLCAGGPLARASQPPPGARAASGRRRTLEAHCRQATTGFQRFAEGSAADHAAWRGGGGARRRWPAPVHRRGSVYAGPTTPPAEGLAVRARERVMVVTTTPMPSQMRERYGAQIVGAVTL